MELLNTWPFESGFFYLAQVFKAHPYHNMCQSFILFYGWIKSTVWICHILFIHSSVKSIWIASTFCLSQIMLLWTQVYKFLCGHGFHSFGCVPRSVSAGPPGTSVLPSEALQGSCPQPVGAPRHTATNVMGVVRDTVNHRLQFTHPHVLNL